MLARTVFALSLMLLAVPAAGAASNAAKAEKECPHDFSEFKKITEAVERAPTCAAALELFSACGSGATSDANLGGAVVERCEKDFVARLSKAQKRAYDREGDRCDGKYANRQGSMYISFTAHCHAEVALKYSRRFAKPVGR